MEDTMTPYYETELGKLYHGDCLEIMPELEPVDLVLTDPPYNINLQQKRKKTGYNNRQSAIFVLHTLTQTDLEIPVYSTRGAYRLLTTYLNMP